MDNTVEEDLQLYLVAPVGYEKYSTIIVATDGQQAQDKVRSFLGDLILEDTHIMVLNVGNSLLPKGFSIQVTRIPEQFH